MRYDKHMVIILWDGPLFTGGMGAPGLLISSALLPFTLHTNCKQWPVPLNSHRMLVAVHETFLFGFFLVILTVSQCTIACVNTCYPSQLNIYLIGSTNILYSNCCNSRSHEPSFMRLAQKANNTLHYCFDSCCFHIISVLLLRVAQNVSVFIDLPLDFRFSRVIKRKTFCLHFLSFNNLLVLDSS